MNKSCAAILAVMFTVIISSMAWMVCLNACGGWTCKKTSTVVPAVRMLSAGKVTA